MPSILHLTAMTGLAAQQSAPKRSTKRKHVDNASSQRQVARRLQLCADVGDAFASVQRSLQRQHLQYQAQKSRADELSRLHVALEQLTRFQALCAAEMNDEMDPQKVMSLLHRTDKLLHKVEGNKKPVAKRTVRIIKRLPRLMTRATSLISERRQTIKEQQELPLKFQWVPMVVWRLYEDVSAAVKEEQELKPMKRALHHVMKTLKDTNPFFYLQVLYRPPPQHLDGEWEISASDNLTLIAQSMDPFFRELKRRSFALKNKSDSFIRVHHGWNKLRFTLAFARRAARHFHFLILHLYALAMGCDVSNVNAGVISEKATSGMLRDDAELRSRLRLCGDSAYSEDNLIKETYEWTPELLVFVDEWRRHRDSKHSAPFGFDRRENYVDFLPQFPIGGRDDRRIPRNRKDVLAGIGFHLCSVDFAWKASRLGTPGFRSMRIEDIGNLERKIKRSLGAVVDLVYKMMLARWMERRQRSAAWWKSLELREEAGKTEGPAQESIEKLSENNSIENGCDDDDDDQGATDAESVEHKDFQRTRTHLPPSNGFRRPSRVVISRGFATPLKEKQAAGDGLAQPLLVAPRRLALDQTIRIGDIYAWTDEDIESFHRDAKRVDEVRAVISALRDRLKRSKVALELASNGGAVPSHGDPIQDDWRLSCFASRLCSLTAKAAAFAEEAAMHEATVALTKRPSLRSAPDTTASSDTEDNNLMGSEPPNESTVEELQESVAEARANVQERLASYDGAHTPEWRDRIQFTGRGIIQLLHSIAQDELLCEADHDHEDSESDAA